MEISDRCNGNQWWFGKYGILNFITVTSRIPLSYSIEVNLGSTGPGKLKEMEKSPGGGNSCTFMAFCRLAHVTTPSIFTFPSSWTPHFKSPNTLEGKESPCDHLNLLSIYYILKIYNLLHKSDNEAYMYH